MNNLGTMYERGAFMIKADARKAIKWYKKAAEGKHATAMFNLGGLLHRQFDYQGAFKWFKEAIHADPKHTRALRGLAALYAAGEGIPIDLAEAHRLLRSAADLGDVDAMMDVGQMLLDGHGVVADISAGKKWVKKAAAGGQQHARTLLAQMSSNQPY